MFCLSDGKTFHAFFYNESRDATGAFLLIGHGKDDEGVRISAIGDEDLGAVDSIEISFLHCCGLLHGSIGPGIGFCQAKCAKFFTGSQRKQIFFFLRFCTEGEKGSAGQ